ncbi:hypothetical protein SBF1_8690001 [Candidatus Desulfosporosinus infrequens]|uniref:Uncharacterized protein n=1 Tax=Candidatus Desulfosporosinus infrequens TaxID=2043169 RepID=A0A2U3LVD2_9FIRM|nr:hypothetical protein SBF1_8690001 [Candidatus Desulfosporosinus infrequens]
MIFWNCKISHEELIQRLSDGKAYGADQATSLMLSTQLPIQASRTGLSLALYKRMIDPHGEKFKH